MNAVATNGNLPGGLRAWRVAVFGGIFILYLISLFMPPLREALAGVFSYFPQ